MRPLVPALNVALLLTPSASALPPPSAAQAARHIEQLGSNSFQEREQATKALEGMGGPALPAL